MNARSADTTKIKNLEKINQIVDLCIDRELFDCIDELLILSDRAEGAIKKLKDKKYATEDFFEICDGERYPVKEVKIPDSVRQCHKGFSTLNPILLTKEGEEPLQQWSQLFWAKRLRAELQLQNRRPWSDRFDDLVNLLERYMPPLHTHNTNPRTAVSFLMELSAAALGCASMGYAERARRLVKVIVESNEVEAEKRYEYGSEYDRWIWFNRGLAYQHEGMLQKAVLEYNAVISKFWRYVEHSKKSYDHSDTALEFLLNVVPATMQRASIQLQLQLGYHALETLACKQVKDWLEELANKDSNGNRGNLFALAVEDIYKRMSLLKVEALIQLGELEQASKYCEGSMPRIFDPQPKLEWKEGGLGLLPPRDLRPAVKIRLVEETVHWCLEKARHWLAEVEKLKNLNDKGKKPSEQELKKIEVALNFFAAILVPDCQAYWEWVKDNIYDEMVFFSRWAQLLSVSSDIARGAAELGLAVPAKELLVASLKLYKCHPNAIPMTRKERLLANRKSKIELENLRSDDLPDLREGLSTFYENISRILLKAGKQDLKPLKDAIHNTFNCKDLLMELKNDHYRLLRAVDEWDREFGENQREACLNRCNEALIWSSSNNSRRSETYCSYKKKHDKIKWGHFKGLLKCAEKDKCNDEASGQADHDPLRSADYESIMQMSERHLTEHLESRSHHAYGHLGNTTLHFIGLQRWNSSTPAQGRSVGGGYLLYRTDKRGLVDLGIAIDPGFDFVRNLFKMGFSLSDIDIVLISHAHPDHLWDFESMVQLLHELEDKRKVTHQLHAVLTLGSYRRLEHVIINPVLRQFINPLIIDIRKEIKPDSYLRDYDKDSFEFRYRGNGKGWVQKLPDNNIDSEKDSVESIQIRPTFAYHDDYSDRSDSFGFTITFTGLDDSEASNRKELRFGYTGDTKWVSQDMYDHSCPLRKGKKCLRERFPNGQDINLCWECVAKQYGACDIVLMHLGSLVDHKAGKGFSDYSEPDCEDLLRKKQHPYLMGTIRFLNTLRHYKEGSDKLILVGEFGEELRGGIRDDLMKRLERGVTHSWPVLPVDVGLDILLHGLDNDVDRAPQGDSRFQFLCAMCERYRPISETIKYPRYGQDEAICYMCNTCYKATPDDVRQNKLRQLYDIGRNLRTLPDDTN